MKGKIVTLFALILLASASRRVREEVHAQSSSTGMEGNTGFDIGARAVEMTDYIIQKFPVTCGKGYKRGVTAYVQNDIAGITLKLKGLYQDSGKVLEAGSYLIPPKANATWYFSKHAGSATGSCGVNVWQIGDSKTGLIVFYENPWSSWNFQGVCIRSGINFANDMSKLPESYVRGLYKELYKKHPNWPNDCILFDNTRQKDEDWRRQLQKSIGGFKLNAIAEYRYLDDAGPNDCYTAGISVQISK